MTGKSEAMAAMSGPLKRRRVLLIIGIAWFAGIWSVVADERVGRIEYETQSLYSHIRIRTSGTIRTLIFVRDTGEEAYESQMDVRRPHLLRFSYLQHMFANYLIQPQQSKCLIVGLGGGSMVHFLQTNDPAVAIDAVEIDAVVVQLAERFFKVKRSDRVKLVVADAFDFIAKTQEKYDTIYMDAFLKPAAGTDETGVPLRLRTINFYKQLQSRLSEGGSVVFNINPYSEMNEDLLTIAEAFPQSYVFSLPNSEGVVAVGSMNTEPLDRAALVTRGRALDKRFPKAGFRFETIASHLKNASR